MFGDMITVYPIVQVCTVHYACTLTCYPTQSEVCCEFCIQIYGFELNVSLILNRHRYVPTAVKLSDLRKSYYSNPRRVPSQT